MNAEQRIKRQILMDADQHSENGVRIEITADNLEQFWEDAEGEDGWGLQDPISEFRCSGEDTGLPSPNSRHYEADSVGRKLSDGTWVGWTYWHGGGKHGEPESIDWLDGAYYLDVTEEEKLVVVKTFKLKEES